MSGIIHQRPTTAEDMLLAAQKWWRGLDGGPSDQYHQIILMRCKMTASCACTGTFTWSTSSIHLLFFGEEEGDVVGREIKKAIAA